MIKNMGNKNVRFVIIDSNIEYPIASYTNLVIHGNHVKKSTKFIFPSNSHTHRAGR